MLAVGRALLIVAVLLGCVWLGGHPSKLPSGLRWLTATPATQGEEAVAQEQVRDLIGRLYFRTTSPDEVDQGAIAGMVASLDDPYSRYLTPRQAEALDEQARGNYAGIGVTLSPQAGGLRVSAVQDASPALQAGLREADVITAVDGQAIKTLAQAAQAPERIRGRLGTSVTLDVTRERVRRVVRVRRAELKLVTVQSRRVRGAGGQVSVIRISQFAGETGAQFRQAVEQARRQRSRAIVLDLRGNPGGLVSEAIDTVSALQGTGVVTTLRGRAVPTQVLRVTGEPADTDTPVRVLIDETSASAAEITAAALADHGRARLVGERSYGKGVYQQVFDVAGGGALDLTVGQYLTPDGDNLGNGTRRGSGITPDVQAADDPDTRVDETLQAALRDLR